MSLHKLNRPSSLLVSEVANVHLIGSFEVAFETGRCCVELHYGIVLGDEF